MKTSFIIAKRDLEIINKVVEENDIKFFTLIQESGSGIGYTTDIEFEFELNGRNVTVRVPVATEDNW